MNNLSNTTDNGILKDYYTDSMAQSPLQKALRKRRKKMGETLEMKV